ncbi:MAG: hypothetical protein WCW66_02115 [Patescibacteria group bacterium]
MKKISLIAIMLLAVAVVAGAGCAKKVSENTAENAIEKSVGGDADVDIDDDSARINVNGSSMAWGENVSLPDNFPSDVYVTEGDLKSAMETADEAFSVTVESTKSLTAVRSEYETELANDGWDVNSTYAIEGSVTLGGEKDDRMIILSISESEGKTMVIITTTKNQ